MAMRLRRSLAGKLVALCAEEVVQQPGDVYIDDEQDHAIREKLHADWTRERSGAVGRRESTGLREIAAGLVTILTTLALVAVAAVLIETYEWVKDWLACFGAAVLSLGWLALLLWLTWRDGEGE